MGELEFGIFDSFGPFERTEFPSVAEVYEAHLHEAQEAEQLGYRYYFFIEHQNAPVCYVTSLNVYLMALASRTSALRFGKSYDFWIDNGLALVGSPDSVIRKLGAQRQLTGYDIFAARHRIGHLEPVLARKSMQLFAKYVIPAFA